MKKSLIFLSFLIFYSSLIVSEAFASVPQPPIVTRAQWWADESIRLGNPSLSLSIDETKSVDLATIIPVQKQSIADNYLETTFPNEFRSDSVIKAWNNKLIRRPVQLNNKKFKIVIHHTAKSIGVNANYEDEIAEIKDIYRFHTLTRKRWDIGYNYVIWPGGTIFEGRYGGPSAVWAHMVNNNGWSIGISLMGNFQQEEPTAQQLQSTIDLTAWLADKYQVDVYRKVTYHESSSEYPYISNHTDESLVWHKDAGDTSCPGVNLYNKLDTIKSQVADLVGNTIPRDDTPIVTDPIKYYIPSTTYQLSIPRTKTGQIISCETNNSIWSIKKCWLTWWYLTLNLNKITSAAHAGYHRVVIQTPQGQIYLNISLEHKTPKPKTDQTVVSIPSTTRYHTWSKVKVMLYDLTVSNTTRIVNCKQWCMVQFGSVKAVKLTPWIRFQLSRDKDQLIFRLSNKKYIIPNITISAIGTGVITVDNYGRMYNNTSLNTRKWSLTRDTRNYKIINKWSTTGIVVTNTVRMDDYMRWLIMTQADTPQSYHDVRYLTANTNLRYRGGNVTDDARIHQYYGGAAAEQLDYKRQLSHDNYRSYVLKNESNLTYAPWFECSNGRTRNGMADIWVCADGLQSGPWVGLSRLWAVMLSQRWYATRQIIEYYYPGVSIRPVQ